MNTNSNDKICSKCGKPCKPETYRINVCSDPLVVSNCCKAAFTDSENDDVVSRVTLFDKKAEKSIIVHKNSSNNFTTEYVD